MVILRALKVKIKYRKNKSIYIIVIKSKALFLKSKNGALEDIKIKHLEKYVVFHKT